MCILFDNSSTCISVWVSEKWALPSDKDLPDHRDRGHEQRKYFEVRPLAKDEMPFEDFLFFSSGGQDGVQWSRTIAILDFRSAQF